MAATFAFVGLEQAATDAPGEHGIELPRQVRSVADAAIHSLSGKWRHQMGGVPREPDTAAAPMIGYAGVKMVDRLSDDKTFPRAAVRSQQLRNCLVCEQCLVGFAGQELELVAPGTARARQHDARTPRIAINDRLGGVRRGVLQIDDEPALLQTATGERISERFADGAR